MNFVGDIHQESRDEAKSSQFPHTCKQKQEESSLSHVLFLPERKPRNVTHLDRSLCSKERGSHSCFFSTISISLLSPSPSLTIFVVFQKLNSETRPHDIDQGQDRPLSSQSVILRLFSLHRSSSAFPPSAFIPL